MASGPTNDGFGRRLRDARERRGISLRQIANATKISVAALEALERNDISRLPGGIFSRAFVRSYAIEVGLDPEATIEAFLAQFPHDSVIAGHPVTHRIDANEAHETNRRMASVFVRLAALSLPLVGLVIYLSGSGRDGVWEPAPARPPALAVPASAAVAEAEPPLARAETEMPPPAPPPASEGERAAPAPDAAPPPSSSTFLTASLVASGPCWALAIADGRQVVARELSAGDREVIDARGELVLTVGDAAAVRLTLNGFEARPLGRPGQVVTLRLTPANFRSYLTSP